MKAATRKRYRNFLLLLLAMLITICWSAYQPRYPRLWFVHSAWVIVGLSVLIATRRHFMLTPLGYTLIWLYGTAMLIGAHFTYEHEPFFSWLQQTYSLSRNHYDRFTHLLSGLTLAILSREILTRRGVVAGRKWLVFLTVAISLAISAFNELLEWWYALVTGREGTFSLGMQGDFWDTQWDMFLTLIGAVSAMFLGNAQDLQIQRLSDASDSMD